MSEEIVAPSAPRAQGQRDLTAEGAARQEVLDGLSSAADLISAARAAVCGGRQKRVLVADWLDTARRRVWAAYRYLRLMGPVAVAAVTGQPDDGPRGGAPPEARS
jgi:hypothetical protein